MLIMMYAHNGGVFSQYSQRSLTRALQKFCVKHERYLTAEIAEEEGTNKTLNMLESRKCSASSACSAVKFLAIL